MRHYTNKSNKEKTSRHEFNKRWINTANKISTHEFNKRWINTHQTKDQHMSSTDVESTLSKQNINTWVQQTLNQHYPNKTSNPHITSTSVDMSRWRDERTTRWKSQNKKITKVSVFKFETFNKETTITCHSYYCLQNPWPNHTITINYMENSMKS